jgi:hypothetical protein
LEQRMRLVHWCARTLNSSGKNQFYSLCLTVCRPGVLGKVRVIRLSAWK